MHVSNLTEVLGQNEAFRALPAEELARVERDLQLLVFKLGDTVLPPGSGDRTLCIVYAGRARVVEEDSEGNQVTLSVLTPGETFGEHALLGVATNRAVRAASDLVVLRLSEVRFQQLATSYPEFREAFEQRVHEGEELSFARRLSILSHLKLPDLRRLVGQLERIELSPGEELIREGDSADSAFIIREGRLHLMKDFHGRTRQLAVIKPGELIGEMGLLYGTPRVATAVAVTPVVALRLTRRVFDDVVSDDEEREAILHESANRLLKLESYEEDRETTTAASEPARLEVKWTKLVPGLLSPAYPLVRVDSDVLSGLACLAMMEAWHRKSGISPAGIERKRTEGEPDSLETLSRTAEDLGYLTRRMRLAPEHLHNLPLPAIVQIDGDAHGHELAVLYSVKRQRVLLANPRRGLLALTPGELMAKWDGEVLTLAHLPTADFADPRSSAIFRQFLPFARPHFGLLLSIVALSMVVQILGLAGPLFSKTIIDEVLVNFDAGLLRLMLLGMLLVTAFQMAAGSLREYLTAHFMRRMSAALQLRFINHVLSLPMRVLFKWGSGDFLVRMNENEKLLRLVSEAGFRVILSSGLIAINFILLYSMSAQLTPVAVVFVLAYGALMFFSSPRLRAADNAVFEARKDSESYFIESITGIETVKSLATEPNAYRKGYGLIQRLKGNEFHAATIAFHVSQLGSLLGQAATLVVLGWGAKLALEGTITTGELVAFNALLGATLAPLSALTGVWDQLQEIRISFERTADVLRIEGERSPGNAGRFPFRGDVTLENVTFRYADDAKPVLQNISLSVRAGQKIALVGRSGSGKTTIASLLLNLYQPAEGRILVDDVEMNNLHKPSLRRQIGFVEQHPYLFSGTIRENIAKADPSAGLETVVAAATLAGAHDFIEHMPLGYDTQIGERGMTLSGGQKQRIVIARALLNNPRMLVLDEATSSLDTESEQAIQRNLDAIMAGKTTFTIAHRLSTVYNSDKIVVLDQGRVVEEGTHSQLMDQRGLYHYLATASA